MLRRGKTVVGSGDHVNTVQAERQHQAAMAPTAIHSAGWMPREGLCGDNGGAVRGAVDSCLGDRPV